jgi:predicted RNase H-like HicB family nuclease
VIENKQQYQTTKSVAQQFEHTLSQLQKSAREENDNPSLLEVQISAVASQLDDLRSELIEYELSQKFKLEFNKHPFNLSPLNEQEGGGWLITWPDLPGCMSEGETPEEALKNGREAFAAWMTVHQESSMKAEEFDQKFDTGEDISHMLDLSKAERPFRDLEGEYYGA